MDLALQLGFFNLLQKLWLVIAIFWPVCHLNALFPQLLVEVYCLKLHAPPSSEHTQFTNSIP